MRTGRRALTALGVCFVIAVQLFTSQSHADDSGASSNLMGTTAHDALAGHDTVGSVPASGGDDPVAAAEGPRYTIRQQCGGQTLGEVCSNPRVCDGPPPGTWYSLYRNGMPIGLVCLTDEQAVQAQPPAQPTLTAGMVSRAFRRLSWPTAELTISPPGGRTLVNLATIFSTDLATSQTQTVTLLGLQVTIEATPTGYTWHAGDGTSWTSTDPGTPYTPGADVETLNTHTYLDGSTTLGPSVDVTYTGRYRVGGGGWIDIPETLTLPGSPVPLEVVEAANNLTR